MIPERWGGPAAILGAVLLGYANSLSGSFQFDDFNVIVDNPSVHSLASWLSAAPKGLRPLLKLTYALNWSVGEGAFGFRLFNVAVHAANAFLVYLLALKALPGQAEVGGVKGGAGPLSAALLFAVHPVQTEAVTYISGRSVSLMALFYLASVYCYVRGVEREERLLTHLLSPALFLLAMLTRETAVTLPAALLLWEAAVAERKARWSTVARRQAVHWALLALAGAVFLLHPVYQEIWGPSIASIDASKAVRVQVRAVTYLLSRMAMVHELNIDPDLRIPSSWTPALAASGILLLALLAAGVASLRKAPCAGFGILWYILHLIPTYSIIARMDVASERHLYIAGMGLFLAIGAGVRHLMNANALRESGRFAGMRVPAAVLLFALLSGFTIARNHDYRSEVALWESTVRLSPGKARAHNNLGYAYQLAGRREQAIASYREALRLDPGHGKAKGNLESLMPENP